MQEGVLPRIERIVQGPGKVGLVVAEEHEDDRARQPAQAVHEVHQVVVGHADARQVRVELPQQGLVRHAGGSVADDILGGHGAGVVAAVVLHGQIEDELGSIVALQQLQDLVVRRLVARAGVIALHLAKVVDGQELAKAELRIHARAVVVARKLRMHGGGGVPEPRELRCQAVDARQVVELIGVFSKPDERGAVAREEFELGVGGAAAHHRCHERAAHERAGQGVIALRPRITGGAKPLVERQVGKRLVHHRDDGGAHLLELLARRQALGRGPHTHVELSGQLILERLGALARIALGHGNREVLQQRYEARDKPARTVRLDGLPTVVRKAQRLIDRDGAEEPRAARAQRGAARDVHRDVRYADTTRRHAPRPHERQKAHAYAHNAEHPKDLRREDEVVGAGHGGGGVEREQVARQDGRALELDHEILRHTKARRRNGDEAHEHARALPQRIRHHAKAGEQQRGERDEADRDAPGEVGPSSIDHQSGRD